MMASKAGWAHGMLAHSETKQRDPGQLDMVNGSSRMHVGKWNAIEFKMN